MQETSHPLNTVASINWAPYRHVDGAWEAYPAREYWDQLEMQYQDLFGKMFQGQDEDVSAGQAAVARSYYVSMLQGLANRVQEGQTVYWNADPEAEDDDATMSYVNVGTGYGKRIYAVTVSITETAVKCYGWKVWRPTN
jgi:hypothetical protein